MNSHPFTPPRQKKRLDERVLIEAVIERTQAGRVTAREHLVRTGKTHKGKVRLGRPFKTDPVVVAKWRKDGNASIADTAEHFGLSLSTVKRYCALKSGSIDTARLPPRR